ncbi:MULTISPECIES: c-type cytochrome [Bacillaceae]|uniref:Cytochrome c n=1 Tax=Evansella alkalicola TaxID=745819 RepID=A0ABS6JYH3_9BACI|nr:MULTISPECIES: cytochrome c [Bacillaceae]MBU9722262.1 cytochrome c [Bacillus alkalicola]
MKKLLVVLGAVLVLGACGGDDADEPAPDTNDADTGTEESAADVGEDVGTYDANNGEEVYVANCIGCHGGDLGGTSGPAIVGYSYDEVKAAIVEGPGRMPGGLVPDEDELHDVSAWVASHQ